MTAKAILAELKPLGSDGYKKVLRNHGVPEPFFGVKIEELKKIQKRIKVDYRLALELYDGLSHCGILHSNPQSRRILQAAALLHEVGRGRIARGQPRRHQKRGQRLIAKLKPPLGWSEEDMRLLAVLVRYHRGALPPPRSPALAGIDRKRRSELLCMMGVLRLANALDEAHRGNVHDIAVTRKDGAAWISGVGVATLSREAERLARARYLLETVCRRPIVIRMGRAKSPAKTSAARPPRQAAEA